MMEQNIPTQKAFSALPNLSRIQDPTRNALNMRDTCMLLSYTCLQQGFQTFVGRVAYQIYKLPVLPQLDVLCFANPWEV